MQSRCQDEPCAEPDRRGASDKNRAEKDVEQQNQVRKPTDIRSAVLQPERVVTLVQCHPDDRDDADDNGDGPPAPPTMNTTRAATRQMSASSTAQTMAHESSTVNCGMDGARRSFSAAEAPRVTFPIGAGDRLPSR